MDSKSQELREQIGRAVLAVREERQRLKRTKTREREAFRRLRALMNSLDRTSEVRVRDTDGDVLVSWGPRNKDEKNHTVEEIAKQLKEQREKKAQKAPIGEGKSVLDSQFNRLLAEEAMKCLDTIGARDEINSAKKRTLSQLEEFEADYYRAHAEKLKNRREQQLNIFVEKDQKFRTRV